MIKKAMILAAGFGKRLHPLTLQHPKPLLKIGNETLLSNTIKLLTNLGIEEVKINVHYLSEQIIKYIKKNKFNVDIKIIKEEDQILDTGGALLNAIKYFSKEPFITINPDTIWSKDYLKELKSMGLLDNNLPPDLYPENIINDNDIEEIDAINSIEVDGEI